MSVRCRCRSFNTLATITTKFHGSKIFLTTGWAKPLTSPLLFLVVYFANLPYKDGLIIYIHKMSLLDALKAAACPGEYEAVRRLYGDQWKSVFFTREGQVWTFDSLEAAFNEFVSVADQSNLFSVHPEASACIEFGVLNLETNKVYEIAQNADCSGLVLFDPETGTVLQEEEFDWLQIQVKQSPPHWPQTS